MRRLSRAFALAVLVAVSAGAQSKTPAKAAPCDSSSVLLSAQPIYGVGVKTIAASCPAFATALDRWFVLNADSVRAWTPAQIVAALAHGVRPAVVVAPPVVVVPDPAPVDTPSTPIVTPPPSGKLCANEPSGSTRIEDQPFAAKLPAKWVDDDRTGFRLGTIVRDATAPLSPPSAVAGLFPAGMTGGGAPFYIYRPFSSAEQYRTLYVCVALKHSADFDNTNGNAGTKLFWPAGDQVQGAQTYVTLDGPAMNLGVNLQGGAERELYANVGDGHVLAKRGQWVIYEFVFGASSSNAAADGTLRIWIDGALTHRYDDVRWQMASDRHWKSFAWNPTYGGGTRPVPHDQTETIDHLRLSGTP